MNSSFQTSLESSTTTSHYRHLQRLHQRRKRTNKSILPNIVDEQSKQEINENIESNAANTCLKLKIH